MDASQGLFWLGPARTSLATLPQEILLTRIFSVVTRYHRAFLAVSVAMFGITAGGVAVFLLSNRLSDPEARLPCYSLYFGFSVLLG